MLKAARMSFSKAKKDIVLFALVNFAIYVFSVLTFKYLNLLHIFGLRMVDYLFLSFVSVFQIHRWVRLSGGYLPFLQAFFTILFTGALSFVFFGAFVFIYSLFDPYLAELYITNSRGMSPLIPAIIILFEGGGASIIVALIASFYAGRFEDGELSS